MDPRLIEPLARLADRYRRFFRWRTLASVWLAAALLGTVLIVLGWRSGWTSPWTAPALGLTALGAAIAAGWRAAARTRDLREVAKRVEARHPELDSLLLAAVEQRPQRPGEELGFLQDCAIRGALAHERQTDWTKDVPDRRLRGTRFAALGSLAALVLVLGGLAVQANQARGTATARGSHVPAGAPLAVTVTPGDTELERGSSLVVTARFDPAVPDDATLAVRDGAGDPARLPMSRSLSDPLYGARVAEVAGDLWYRVEYAGQGTREYRVTVFEYPRLERADAELVFPSYTAMGSKRVEDTRRVSAVEGTELTLLCRLNKPVASARLVPSSRAKDAADVDGSLRDRARVSERLAHAGEAADLQAETDGAPAGDEGVIDLAVRGDDATLVAMTRVLERTMRYRLELVDAEGRENQEPPELVFQVTPNRRPEIKVVLPARDVRVSPLEELQTKAIAWDDYGLLAAGISYTLPGSPPQEIALGESNSRDQRLPLERLIAFEELAAQPDQLLAYHFWADDAGPDGKPRRTMSDMYFAEVRHLEEIFRQGEQQAGEESQQQQQQQGQGENAQQAEELAELQKQIINATWKVIRRETASPPTPEFAADAEQLARSQSQALEQLAELQGQLEDPESAGHAAAVEQQMTAALTALTTAQQSSSPASLTAALAEEQAAYQALLKLRAREFRVSRGRQRSQQSQSASASGQQSRAQQQLDQLELNDSENRYETQRQALSPQQQAQQENLELQNRLRDLARRQADLNERLKELQAALDQAPSEQQQEEIREQLKRLREQEQQMLRDLDELGEQMAQSEDQQRMSQPREDLEQTRENVRQAGESIEQGQISQAVASGTRAERQLDNLREEFRRAASNRFRDELRELRDAARQLEEQETSLADGLRGLTESGQDEPRSLRRPDPREPLRQGLQQQREELEQLLENIRETVEQAEESEPLMADGLYDTYRQTQQQRVGETLDQTRQLVERGILDQAQLAEAQAARGIHELREGVEAAADGILGDDEEALRRAQETLEELAAEVNEELRRAGVGRRKDDSPSREPGGEDEPRSAAEASGQPGEASGQEEAARRPRDGRPGDEPRLEEQGEAGRKGGKRPPGDPSGRREADRDRAGQQPSGQQLEQGQASGGTPEENPSGQADQPQGQPKQGPSGKGQPGQRQPGAGQPGAGQPGEQPSGPRQRGEAQAAEGQPAEGQRSDLQPADGQPGLRGRPAGPLTWEQANAGRSGPGGAAPFRRPDGPITGDFLRWSERLRDVEEMLEDPQLRGDAARIRETARELRRDMRDGVQGPNWDLVQDTVAEPLNELRDRVAEELARLTADDAMVPIDRDPVPPKYEQPVRRYYELLGGGR